LLKLGEEKYNQITPCYNYLTAVRVLPTPSAQVVVLIDKPREHVTIAIN